MKVISGIYKGRTIEGYNMKKTRPTMDRVKESLFATIQDYLKDGIVLDLFSGTASLAIESLSQGAKIAYAVDHNKEAIKTINKNIESIGVKNCISIKNDYKEAIKYFSENNLKFDLIFLDPPYDTDYIKNSIELIIKHNILKENGIIVCESDDINKIYYSSLLKEVKSKKYGNKIVVIFKKI